MIQPWILERTDIKNKKIKNNNFVLVNEKEYLMNQLIKQTEDAKNMNEWLIQEL